MVGIAWKKSPTRDDTLQAVRDIQKDMVEVKQHIAEIDSKLGINEGNVDEKQSGL